MSLDGPASSVPSRRALLVALDPARSSGLVSAYAGTAPCALVDHPSRWSLATNGAPTQVCLPDGRIRPDFHGAPCGNAAALIEDHDAVDEAHDQAQVMLDDEYPKSMLLAKLGDSSRSASDSISLAPAAGSSSRR